MERIILRGAPEVNATDPFHRVVDALGDRIKNRGKGSVQACCPSHDDNRASLSVSRGDDGRALVTCHAGRGVETIVGALGLTMRDLFAGNGNGAGSQARHVDETYDYLDEQGEVLYQVIRYFPKDFRQRAPDGTWSVKGIAKVPYRLPELVRRTDEAIYIVEGEKDVHALEAFGLLATCNPGGAGKWRNLDRATVVETFRDRDAVLIPDNDDTGRDHANDVVRRLSGIAKRVRTVYLPGLTPKGDVSDWIAVGGTREALDELVDAAREGVDRDEDDDGSTERSEYHPFPIDLMPRWVENYIRDRARAIGCDQWYVAVPVLGALAGVIGTAREIALSTGWTEPGVLWLTLVAPPGAGKTAPFKEVRDAVGAIEAGLRDSHQNEREAFERALQEHKRELASFNKGKRDDAPGSAPEPPPVPHVAIEDSTIESVGNLLRGSNRGVVLLSDELGEWLASFTEYKPTGGDVQRWCRMYDGGKLKINRIARGEIVIDNAACSVAGGIQPGIWERSAADPEKVDSGLIARLSVIAPPRRKVRFSRHRPSWDIGVAFERGLRELHSIPMRQSADGQRLLPYRIAVSPEAEELFIRWHDEAADRALDWMNEPLEANVSKVRGLALRCALILHCASSVENDDVLGGGGDIDPISAQTMARGIALADELLHHTIRAWTLRQESGADKAQRELIGYIRSKGGQIAVRTLRRNLRKYAGEGGAARAEADLDALGDADLGHWEDVDHEGAGRPTMVFVLNPPTDADTPHRPNTDTTDELCRHPQKPPRRHNSPQVVEIGQSGMSASAPGVSSKNGKGA